MTGRVHIAVCFWRGICHAAFGLLKSAVKMAIGEKLGHDIAGMLASLKSLFAK